MFITIMQAMVILLAGQNGSSAVSADQLVACTEKQIRERGGIAMEDREGLASGQVFPFIEGAVYQLHASPLNITDLILGKGERLISVSGGGGPGWMVCEPRDQSAANDRPHILIRPHTSGLSMGITLRTDQRTYHLEVLSLERNGMSSVAWTYAGPDN